MSSSSKHMIPKVLMAALMITGLAAVTMLVGQSQDVRQQASTNLVDIAWVAEDTTVHVGEEVTLSLFITPNGNPVTAVDLPLMFNDSLFEVVEVEAKGMFNSLLYGPEEVENGVWVSAGTVPMGVSEEGEVLSLTLKPRKTALDAKVTLELTSTNVAVLGMNSENMLGTVTPVELNIVN